VIPRFLGPRLLGMTQWFFGDISVKDMAATAKIKLQKNFYFGLREHGYSEIDERTMLSYLTARVKTPTLDHVKTWILSDVDLSENFSSCVNRLHHPKETEICCETIK